jgi:putative peptide zinc metalloprotease protein
VSVDRPTFSESWYRVANLRPVLRSTVQVHRQHYRGMLWHVLQDPASNQHYRLNEPAWQFVGMLDGRRTVAEVWHACMDVLGDEAPTQGEVIQLMGQLYASNLLAADLPPDAVGLFQRYRKRVHREVKGYLSNLLFVRFPLLDPDRFLDRWVHLTGWIFSKWMLIPWLTLLAVGGYFVIGNIDELTDRASGILAPDNLLFLYLSFAFIKLFHEFGHAFACKTFGKANGSGGEVHTIGIMLLVFTPMPYVDASSSWTLPSKWQRAAVAASGMYIELAIAAISAIVWANTGQGTTVHAICYNVMFIASVTTLLFNANPLLRYDGYYILSDLLEIPNLSDRSKRQIYHLVKKYIWRVRHSISPAHTFGERFWFPVYGVASMAYRVFICSAILMFVAESFFKLGLVLAALAFVTWVLAPLWKFLKYLLTSQELTRVRPWAITTTLLFFGVVGYLIGSIEVSNNLRSEGVIEPRDMQIVFSKEPGFVETLLPSGTSVTRGEDVLLRCSNPELLAQLRQLQARREELEITRRAARFEEEAAAQIYAQKIQAIDQQIRRVEDRLDDLEVRSTLDGVWITPNKENITGTYLQPGRSLGTVARLENLHIRAVVGQPIVAALEEADRDHVQIRVKGRPDLETVGSIVNILPAGKKELFSQALAFQSGGSVETDTSNPQQPQAAENYFEVRVRPRGDTPFPLRSGQRVVIRFVLPSEPLALQWYRRIRQVVMKRFRL